MSALRKLQGPVLLMLPVLAGCATLDPYERPGQWQPVGANARNLAAMVANPRDLIRGHGDARVTGVQATTPVTALLAGKPAPLPNDSSQSGTGSPAGVAPPVGN